MKRSTDKKIRMKLLENDVNIPNECQKRIEITIERLPEKENKKKHIRFRTAVAIAVVCLLTPSIIAFAAIDYVRQRMENLTEEEKDNYYEGLLNSPANADSYSREFTEGEEKRIKELREKYENGTFPVQKLPVINTQAEVNGSMKFYYVEDTSLFVLPSRELTEEEILEMIDFYNCRDFSLTERTKDLIVTQSPKGFNEIDGMDEEKALEMAKADISKAYGIDSEKFETSENYYDFDRNSNTYDIRLTDKETMINYYVMIDADQELVTSILIMKDNNITEGVEVDQKKFTAKYEDALDILKKWKGADLSFVQSSCEYNYNSEDCLENGLVSYLFEMEDGTGYKLFYSCENDEFFEISMIDYNEYRQNIEQLKKIKQKKGINREIIQMQ